MVLQTLIKKGIANLDYKLSLNYLRGSEWLKVVQLQVCLPTRHPRFKNHVPRPDSSLNLKLVTILYMEVILFSGTGPLSIKSDYAANEPPQPPAWQRCGDRSGQGNMAASASPGDWRHWLRLSSPGQMGSEQRWQRYQHSPVWVTRPETTPGLQSPWKLSVATEVSTSELDLSEVKTWIGAWHEDVLPGAVPRHEVASWSGPEDVQHADVLPAVLRQIFWSVWWVSYFS